MGLAISSLSPTICTAARGKMRRVTINRPPIMGVLFGDATPMNMQMQPPQVGAASRWRVWLVGGVVLAALVGGYWYFSQDSAPVRKRSTVIPVRVGLVERREMAVVEHTLGTVVPFTTVQVAARVQGVIDSTSFKEGQFVKTGDLLFVIDPRPYQAAYDNALATLANLQGQGRPLPEIAGAERHLAPGRGRCPGRLSGRQIQCRSGAAQSGIHPYPLAGGRQDRRDHGPDRATWSRPPTMTPLVTIDQIHPIKVSFSLPQTDLPLIQARQRAKGLAATVVSQGVGGKPLAAPVDFISNAVNNVSGTIELRSTFNNEDNALVPGQLVNVSVQLDDIPDALVVPHEAVNIGPDGNYVFALKDAKVVQKPVTVLFDDGKSTAVKGDLTPGESVVTDGQLRLVPGATVVAEGAKPARRPGAKRARRASGRRGTEPRHEHLAAVHRISGDDHAADGGVGDFRHRRLFRPAHQRTAQCGFSHRAGQRQPGRRRSARPWPRPSPRRWKTPSRRCRASIRCRRTSTLGNTSIVLQFKLTGTSTPRPRTCRRRSRRRRASCPRR